jgi:predicted RNase H-like nuclease (RuvC/YqgF family)
MTTEQSNTKLIMPIKDTIILDSKKCNAELLTIHSDGRITVAEHLKPTETAAKVLQIVREQWMADAQARKIREQEERIKRLEEELNELRSDEARLLNSNGELERRIKRLLEAGDKMANSTDIREYSVAIQNWTKAKEAKL